MARPNTFLFFCCKNLKNSLILTPMSTSTKMRLVPTTFFFFLNAEKNDSFINQSPTQPQRNTPFFRRLFWNRNPEKDSGLGFFCSESQGNSNGIRSRFLSFFVYEIITVENRETSRKTKVSPSVYIDYRRIFGL
jgi:hypothetical protein